VFCLNYFNKIEDVNPFNGSKPLFCSIFIGYLEGWSSEYNDSSRQKMYAWMRQIPSSKIV
jgi:hypothetical protein